MALAKRLNRRAHALMQPLGQSAEYPRPLGVAAFGFLFAVDFLHAHRECRVIPVPRGKRLELGQSTRAIAALQLCGELAIALTPSLQKTRPSKWRSQRRTWFEILRFHLSPSAR